MAIGKALGAGADRTTGSMRSGRFVLLPMASCRRGPLSPACEQCAQGLKMVLFVTGRCRFRCFYCPVSPARYQLDVVYANERRVSCDADVLEEARAIGAAGTGITGGDPLAVVARVEHYVRLLKDEFGPSHDLHLYTHEPNPEKLHRLARVGLDEFRLHIPPHLWGPLSGPGRAYRHLLERSAGWGIRRGVEVPVLPEKEAELRRLLTALDGIGIDFVNLNELEFSETNAKDLLARGYRADEANGWGVQGSRAVAERLVRELGLSVPLHYCSSRFKDGVQLRQRLLRRADRTAPAFAAPTRDGTIVLGVVEAGPVADLDRWASHIVARLGVRPGRYRLDRERRRVEVDAARLRRFAARLSSPAFEVERYPTVDALEVERAPLNAAAKSTLGVGAGGT